MNEIKYEAVFGPQELFDGAPEDCILAVVVSGEDKTFYLENNKSKLRGKVLVTVNGIVNLAMRRIIRTPTWTKEDQKAGKLPEVGCIVVRKKSNDECLVVFKSSNVIVLFSESFSSAVSVSKSDFFNYFRALETPEEKASRLREEWCANAAKQLKNLEYSSTLTSIYDALLSGELKMPEVKK